MYTQNPVKIRSLPLRHRPEIAAPWYIACIVTTFLTGVWPAIVTAQPAQLSATVQEKTQLSKPHKKIDASMGTPPFNGWGMYTEELDGQEFDANAIASFGVSYVIYFYRGDTNPDRLAKAVHDFKNFENLGIGVALWVTNNATPEVRTQIAAQFKTVPNLIAWYVFDEPILRKKSIDEQDAAIAAMRSIRNLPCVVAENAISFPSFQLSGKYDFIFVDRYHQYLLGNTAADTDTKKLDLYGSVESYEPLVGLKHIVTVYGAFEAATRPLLPTADLTRTFIAQKEMFGPGAIFIYQARKSGGSLGTIERNNQLQDAVHQVIEHPVKAPGLASASIALPSQKQNYSLDKIKATWSRILNQESTATLEYSPARDPKRNGAFLAPNQSLIIDLGQTMRSVRIHGRFFNDGNPTGTTNEFQYFLRNSGPGTQQPIKARSVKTSADGTATFRDTLENVNSRFIEIRPSDAAWNTRSGFDSIGFSGLKYSIQ